MPLFSVVISLYNKENFIEMTLKSVLNQTFEDFEILIINDGSTDRSEKKVLNFNDSRIHYFFKPNEGVSATRNFGIEKASGKYIAFLDADDYWFPSFLENMVYLIAKYPTENVFSAAIQVQIKEKIFEATYSISKEFKTQIVNFFDASHDQCAISSSSVVIEKSVFKIIGNFDINLKTDEDTDLWIRIGLHYPIVFSWDIGAKYNYDATGLSKESNFSEKTDFSKYLELEKSNLELRKFLALHRFSMALKCKISGQDENFNRFYKLIELKFLTKKQRTLLILPTFLLKIIFKTKLLLQKGNIRLSAFK